MYQDLIRNELNEAAETLANFLKDDANIHAIQRAAVLLADSFKAGGKVLLWQRRLPLRRHALCRRVDRSLP